MTRPVVTVRVVPITSRALVTCHPAHVIRIKSAYASDWQLESESDTDTGQVVLTFTRRARA